MNNSVIERRPSTPYFSVCIPQYNRTSFLLEALRVLDSQTFRDFEVCISDGNSTDGRDSEVKDFLLSSGLSFAYRRSEVNLRYDPNLRASMELATGRYCVLHGNDDCLKDSQTLAVMNQFLEENGRPAVLIPNFQDWSSGAITRRVKRSTVVGSGPQIAAARFRDVSFVTGVVLAQSESNSHRTTHWDGSEMYQMYMMARLIATGGSLATLDASLVRKDIQVEGESVDNYARQSIIAPCPITERLLPLRLLARLVADAIDGTQSASERTATLSSVVTQLYVFTYPFWIVEYRRVQSWRYAAGLCVGLKPQIVAHGLHFGVADKTYIWILWMFSCVSGLLVPIRLFKKLRPLLHKFAVAWRQ